MSSFFKDRAIIKTLNKKARICLLKAVSEFLIILLNLKLLCVFKIRCFVENIKFIFDKNIYFIIVYCWCLIL